MLTPYVVAALTGSAVAIKHTDELPHTHPDLSTKYTSEDYAENYTNTLLDTAVVTSSDNPRSTSSNRYNNYYYSPRPQQQQVTTTPLRYDY